MAYLEFWRFCSFYFLEEASLQALRAYANKMFEFLQNHYQVTTFSENAFLQRLEPLLVAYDPRAGISYDFKVSNSNLREEWRVYLRLTQISHIESGIVSSIPEDAKPDDSLDQCLLDIGLASVVSRMKFIPQKGFRGLFGNNALITEKGHKKSIYLKYKIGAKSSLTHNLRWEPLSRTNFSFFDFAERVEALLSKDDPNDVVTFLHSNDEDVQAFIKSCDNRIVSSLSDEELTELFSLVNLTAEEWFSIHVA